LQDFAQAALVKAKMQRVYAMIAAVMCAVLASAAHAQYPTKPVRIIVPFAAGSSTDVITRILAYLGRCDA